MVFFFDLCQEAQKLQQMNRQLATTEFKLFFFPWWRDPRYVADSKTVTFTKEETLYFEKLANKREMPDDIKLTDTQRAWYVLKWRQQKLGGTDKIKQEFPSTPTEAFEAQTEGAFYGELIAIARRENRILAVPYEPTIPVNTFWDIGHNDKNCIWFHQQVGTQHRFIDYYENSGEPLHHYVRVIRDRGYIYGEHYLPHDVQITDISRADNKTRAEVLQDLGLRPLRIVPRVTDIREGIEMTRNVLPSCFFDESRCDRGIRGLENYRKEWDDRMQSYKDRPLHDWASDAADAFRQFAQGYNSNTKTRRIKRRKRRGKGSVQWKTV